MSKEKNLEQEVRKFIRETIDSTQQKTSQLKPKKSISIGAILLTLAFIILTGVITYHYKGSSERQAAEKEIDFAFKPVPDIIKEKQRNTPLFAC